MTYFHSLSPIFCGSISRNMKPHSKACVLRSHREDPRYHHVSKQWESPLLSCSAIYFPKTLWICIWMCVILAFGSPRNIWMADIEIPTACSRLFGLLGNKCTQVWYLFLRIRYMHPKSLKISKNDSSMRLMFILSVILFRESFTKTGSKQFLTIRVMPAYWLSPSDYQAQIIPKLALLPVLLQELRSCHPRWSTDFGSHLFCLQRTVWIPFSASVAALSLSSLLWIACLLMAVRFFATGLKNSFVLHFHHMK